MFDLFKKKAAETEPEFDMPDFATIAIWAGKFITAGTAKEKIGPVLIELAQEPKAGAIIAKMTTGIITGLAAYQKAKGCNFGLHAESTPNGQDICIRIFKRTAGSTDVEYTETFFLSEASQPKLVSLLNLIFSNGTEH